MGGNAPALRGNACPARLAVMRPGTMPRFPLLSVGMVMNRFMGLRRSLWNVLMHVEPSGVCSTDISHFPERILGEREGMLRGGVIPQSLTTREGNAGGLGPGSASWFSGGCDTHHTVEPPTRKSGARSPLPTVIPASGHRYKENTKDTAPALWEVQPGRASDSLETISPRSLVRAPTAPPLSS